MIDVIIVWSVPTECMSTVHKHTQQNSYLFKICDVFICSKLNGVIYGAAVVEMHYMRCKHCVSIVHGAYSSYRDIIENLN